MAEDLVQSSAPLFSLLVHQLQKALCGTDKGHHSSAIKINTFNMIRIHTYKMISVLICAGGEKNPPQ